jgi:hypothetical protein
MAEKKRLKKLHLSLKSGKLQIFGCKAVFVIAFLSSHRRHPPPVTNGDKMKG